MTQVRPQQNLTPEFRNRVELLQDFEFPEATNRIKVSRDGKTFLRTTSLYFLRRIFLSNLSITIERFRWNENPRLKHPRTADPDPAIVSPRVETVLSK